MATKRRAPIPKTLSDQGNWNARMRCTVIKNVRLENCTEEQARVTPWEFATHEQESDQVDWEVEKLEKAE